MREPYVEKHNCDEHDPCEGSALHIRSRCEAGGCTQFQDGSWFMRNVCWNEHPGRKKGDRLGEADVVRAWLEAAFRR